MSKNPIAVALGMMGKGVPRNFTKAERLRRSKRMKAVNAKRKLEKAA